MGLASETPAASDDRQMDSPEDEEKHLLDDFAVRWGDAKCKQLIAKRKELELKRNAGNLDQAALIEMRIRIARMDSKLREIRNSAWR